MIDREESILLSHLKCRIHHYANTFSENHKALYTYRLSFLYGTGSGLYVHEIINTGSERR